MVDRSAISGSVGGSSDRRISSLRCGLGMYENLERFHIACEGRVIVRRRKRKSSRRSSDRISRRRSPKPSPVTPCENSGVIGSFTDSYPHFMPRLHVVPPALIFALIVPYVIGAQGAPLPAATGLDFRPTAAGLVGGCRAAVAAARAEVAAIDASPEHARTFANTLGRAEQAGLA